MIALKINTCIALVQMQKIALYASDTNVISVNRWIVDFSRD